MLRTIIDHVKSFWGRPDTLGGITSQSPVSQLLEVNKLYSDQIMNNISGNISKKRENEKRLTEIKEPNGRN